MKFTSVLTLHLSKYGCGVGRFSGELARRIGVPLREVFDRWGVHPLLSLKWAELDDSDRMFVWDEIGERELEGLPYSVFWHDSGEDLVTKGAEHVFFADPSLGEPGFWCPSLITPRKRHVRLFSFGMAHKLQTDKYQRVRELLDAAGERYHLRVSVGLHEGTSLNGAEKHFDALRAIMGEENVTILGILSDDAVSEELANANYVLAFFEKGLRANNTTVHAALEARCEVVTNHDADTPMALKIATTDINDTTNLAAPCWCVRTRFYSWDHLIAAMRKECDKFELPTVS